MTNLELVKKLEKFDVLTLVECGDNIIYVESCGDCGGWAYLTFDEKGECIKVDIK